MTEEQTAVELKRYKALYESTCEGMRHMELRLVELETNLSLAKGFSHQAAGDIAAQTEIIDQQMNMLNDELQRMREENNELKRRLRDRNGD